MTDPANIRARHRVGIDRIRVAMTALVILHHTAIVYGGSGGWFWRQEPNASNLLLVMFNTVNQAYFMGLFFLLAGYFTPGSYDRKGAVRFLADRLVRLGIPLLVFFFLLHPLTVAIARTNAGHPFWRGWREMIWAGEFGPGPLWFAEALLMFAGGYMVWRASRRGAPSVGTIFTVLPIPPVLGVTAITVGISAFVVRLVVPVGREVFWLQLGYFPSYIFLFVAGCAAARSHLLERITFREAAPWIFVSFLALISLPIVLLTRSGAGAFEGGFSVNALFYALWEPLFAWGVILGLLWTAQKSSSHDLPFDDWLGRAAFGAYIVHPPVLVAFSIGLASWTGSPMAKLVIVGVATCIASFSISAVLRRLPLVPRAV